MNNQNTENQPETFNRQPERIEPAANSPLEDKLPGEHLPPASETEQSPAPPPVIEQTDAGNLSPETARENLTVTQTADEAVKLIVNRADCRTPHSVGLVRNESNIVTDARLFDQKKLEVIGAKPLDQILQEAGAKVPDNDSDELEISFSPYNGAVMVVTPVISAIN